ncbi:hypothetical protein CUMW_183630 [Citrus unshiu]|uniref:Uncharacterized protein n=1 Tax=Citrus unshiu TaxID=55188 RepID=A0A2H5Q035_CITUN|nr:hypothetical protein CUMW_183630 [Citrus unshiu]
MEKIKSEDAGAYKTLRKVHPRFWSKHAFDKTSKSDHCTNNMTESFNAWLDDEEDEMSLATTRELAQLTQTMPTRRQDTSRTISKLTKRWLQKKGNLKLDHCKGTHLKAITIQQLRDHVTTVGLQFLMSEGLSHMVARLEFKGSSVQVGGKDMVIGNEQSRALDKGKVPAFPPWRYFDAFLNHRLMNECKDTII